MFNRWGSGLLVPCLNLPGFTGPRGLPVGIQLMGALDDDLRLLRFAKWIAARIVADPAREQVTRGATDLAVFGTAGTAASR